QAQLCETCNYDTISAPGVGEALTLLHLARMRPVLVVVDTGQAPGELGPADIEHLLYQLPETPAVLITSALQRSALAPLSTHRTVFLTRPVSIGAVAEAARRLLEQKGHTPE
ncbi:MAG: hypothetical protein N2508_15755, partial [Anaerolineae bacterium]|nr:hypothetical protein [Anaerolineae bacterium]